MVNAFCQSLEQIRLNFMAKLNRLTMKVMLLKTCYVLNLERSPCSLISRYAVQPQQNANAIRNRQKQDECRVQQLLYIPVFNN